MKNNALSRATSSSEANPQGLRRCKFVPCSVEFMPRRKDQVFHSPACKTKYTMAAYEAGLKVIERKRPNFHFAKLEDSPQLQSLHAVFLRHKGEVVTTLQLFESTRIMSISTRIAELRQNKVNISKAVYMGKSATGAKVFGYQLID